MLYCKSLHPIQLSPSDTYPPYICKISERYKLYDVSNNGIPPTVLQPPIVSVQEIHGIEVRISDPHDNERHRQT